MTPFVLLFKCAKITAHLQAGIGDVLMEEEEEGG
jgi:hypothetical protein